MDSNWGNQTINYPRRTVWDDVDFTFETTVIQPSPGMLMTFVHIEVFTWSLSVLKKLKHLWSSNRHLLPPIVFAQGDKTDAKWTKFVTQLGFTPILEDCPCSDGQNRHVYAHFRKS